MNRPLVSGRAEDLADLIRRGVYCFNGDSIRFDWEGNLLDGQHRLWAIVLAGLPIDALLVFGLDPEVFDTIDVGARRSAADTVGTLGVSRHRMPIASACQYLIRWDRGDFHESDKLHRVNNTDVKMFWRDHADLAAAVAQCYPARAIMPVGLLTAFFYRIAERNSELADRLIRTLTEPAGVSASDPFFLLRDYALNLKYAGKPSPIPTLARAIKAANAAAAGKRLQKLQWRRQGRGAESFPVLDIG